MSKVVLDGGAPEQIADRRPGHDVQNVRQLGLKGTKNGKLLDAFETRGFEAVVSNDKKLEFDQNVSQRPFSVLLLSTSHWPTVEPNVGRVAEALKTAKRGTVTKVDCGKFVPRKFRNLSP